MTFTKKLTFADYLALETTGLEGRAELIDGELIELPPKSGLNLDIAAFVYMALISLGIPYPLIHMGRCEVQTPILEPRDAANRYPDLVVLRPEHLAATRQRMTITLEMPPPRWIMEVVSSGPANYDRDYIRKRGQYAAVGIPEYLIVDPQEGVVIVLQLANGTYQEIGRHQGHQPVLSATFPDLNLTAEQILTAGQ
jgi:Uma2 family endonuclease